MHDEGPEKKWFKTRSFGWGWTPASREGWLVIVIYLGIVISVAQVAETAPRAFSLTVLIATVTLILIAYRTGERPEWRWGRGPFACKTCGLHYTHRRIADACDRHCSETKTCDPDITSRSIEWQNGNKSNSVKDS